MTGVVLDLSFVLRQSLATIQLTPEESAKYRDCPVTLNFGTNFYTFPVG